MYVVFTYTCNWLEFMVNVGKSSINGASIWWCLKARHSVLIPVASVSTRLCCLIFASGVAEPFLPGAKLLLESNKISNIPLEHTPDPNHQHFYVWAFLNHLGGD